MKAMIPVDRMARIRLMEMFSHLALPCYCFAQWTVTWICGGSRPSLSWPGFAEPPFRYAGQFAGMAIICPEIQKDPWERSALPRIFILLS